MKTLLTLFTLIFSFTFSFTSWTQNSLDFDGVDDRIDCGNEPSIQIVGTAITLEAWIYPTSWRDEVWRGNIINKELMGPNYGYMLRCGNNGSVNFNLGNGSWHELSTSEGTLVLNEWQHVAATYDGATQRIYVDGVEIATSAGSFSISSNDQHLVIGDNSDAGRQFPGKIDEVKIWNITRTAEQILDDMNDTYCPSIMPIAGLQAYYNFNQGETDGLNTDETILFDLSGNDNDGTLENFSLFGFGGSNWTAGYSDLTYLGYDHSEISISACYSYTVPSGDETYTIDGVYLDTLVYEGSCDQLLTINLTFDGLPDDTTINRTVCDSYVVPSGDETYYESGVYNDTLPTAFTACDSVITINLTVNHSSESIINPVVCDSYESPSGTEYTESGTFTDMIPNIHGCDSIITINLIVNEITTATLDIESCDSYTVPSGDETYAETGTFMDTIVNAMGCDSIITINLTILEIDASVSPFDLYLSADLASATYQWVDCGDGFSIIPDATEQDFYPEVNGNYAVIVTSGECSDTSDCYSISSLGITETNALNYTIYPNPSTGKFNIQFQNSTNVESIELSSLDGKTITTYQLNDQQQLVFIDLAIESGVYTLTFISEGTRKSDRILILD